MIDIPPDLLATMQAAAAGHEAGEEARALGGDPAVLDALAQLRSEVVEGVTLYANPAATYCALRLIRPFYPEEAESTAGDSDLEIDRLAGMSYCFAEPVRAYLMARKGEEPFLIAVMDWMGRHFTGGDATFKLGRVAGYCAGVLRLLDALNPRMPVPPTKTQPGSPVAAPDSLPAHTPVRTPV